MDPLQCDHTYNSLIHAWKQLQFTDVNLWLSYQTLFFVVFLADGTMVRTGMTICLIECLVSHERL
jgi:hypothetical protein